MQDDLETKQLIADMLAALRLAIVYLKPVRHACRSVSARNAIIGCT